MTEKPAFYIKACPLRLRGELFVGSVTQTRVRQALRVQFRANEDDSDPGDVEGESKIQENWTPDNNDHNVPNPELGLASNANEKKNDKNIKFVII